MRNIGLMLAVVVGCGMATGCNSRPPTSILRVLRADKELGSKRDSLPPNATPSQGAWAVGQYCNALEAIDMSDCPPDFRVAYRDHMRAWREAQAAIQQLPDGYLQGVFMGTLNSILRGETDGGMSRLENDLKRATERVRSTWVEVEKTGAKYGAAL